MNPWPVARSRGAADMLRWVLQRAISGAPPDPDPSVFAPVRPMLPSGLGPGDLAVTWIGHATVLLRLAGRHILTDPMFGARASPTAVAGPRRWSAPGVPLAALPAVHTVLLSHSHYDHLDAPSVRAIATRWPEAQWHVPLRLG